MRPLILLSLVFLGACGGSTVIDNPVEVYIPVPQPCADPRPTPPSILLEDYTDEKWCDYDSKIAGKCTGLGFTQKAAAATRKAVENREYGQALNVATAACPTIKE